MIKTLTYTAIHFSIAFAVAYLLTASVTLGGLIALVEPLTGMVAFYGHDKLWARLAPDGLPAKKTVTFAAVHFAVSFAVTSLIAGDLFIGGMVAVIEPTLNVVAFYFHERLWSRRYATPA